MKEQIRYSTGQQKLSNGYSCSEKQLKFKILCNCEIYHIDFCNCSLINAIVKMSNVATAHKRGQKLSSTFESTYFKWDIVGVTDLLHNFAVDILEFLYKSKDQLLSTYWLPPTASSPTSVWQLTFCDCWLGAWNTAQEMDTQGPLQEAVLQQHHIPASLHPCTAPGP